MITISISKESLDRAKEYLYGARAEEKASAEAALKECTRRMERNLMNQMRYVSAAFVDAMSRFSSDDDDDDDVDVIDGDWRVVGERREFAEPVGLRQK